MTPSKLYANNRVVAKLLGLGPDFGLPDALQALV